MKHSAVRLTWMVLIFTAAFIAGTTSPDWFTSRDPFWTQAQSSKLSADEQSNIEIYNRAARATVNITSTVLKQGWWYEVYPSAESGSGFLVDAEGRILTNHHVIGGNAPKIEVTLADAHDHQRYEAEVLAVDESNDLALIKINPNKPLSHLDLGNSEDLRVGQKVLAIGNPFGLEGTLTTGIISSLGRSIGDRNGVLEEMIQTDAAINPGNSGGPLLDSSGAVIGVNTAIYGKGGNIGIGFAMPISRARPLLEFVRSGGTARQPRHPGMRTRFLDARWARGLKLPATGYLTLEVQRGSAAAQAGVRGATREIVVGNYLIPWGGDYIIEVDGRPVTHPRVLSQAMSLKQGGDTLRLKVIRGGEEVELTLTLQSETMRL